LRSLEIYRIVHVDVVVVADVIADVDVSVSDYEDDSDDVNVDDWPGR
jgi:hypothetical protein